MQYINRSKVLSWPSVNVIQPSDIGFRGPTSPGVLCSMLEGLPVLEFVGEGRTKWAT